MTGYPLTDIVSQILNVDFLGGYVFQENSADDIWSFNLSFPVCLGVHASLNAGIN